MSKKEFSNNYDTGADFRKNFNPYEYSATRLDNSSNSYRNFTRNTIDDNWYIPKDDYGYVDDYE